MPQDEGVRALFAYGGAVATAISAMKYRNRPDLALRFGRALGIAFVELGGSADAVVSVPLHRQRLIARGFDQSALVARAFAKTVGVPHEPGVLVRIRHVAPQATLGRAARLANVRGAFRCPRADRVRGRRLVLVDDVRTTGATLCACGLELEQSGARQVVCVVVAVAGPP